MVYLPGKRLFFFIVLLTFLGQGMHSFLHAQNQCKDSSDNRKAQLYFREALQAEKNKKNTEIALLRKALVIDTALTSAWYKLGELYHIKAIQSQYDILLHQHAGFYFKKAEDCFTHVIYQCEAYNDYASFYYLGENYYMLKEFSLSGYYLKYFLDHSINRWPVNNQAELYYNNYLQWKYWQNNPYPVKIVPLEEVATKNDEILPFITHSGNRFFFKRRVEKPQKNSLYHVMVEEYYQSELTGVDSNQNLIFSSGTPLDWPFAKPDEIKEISISNDQLNIFVTHFIKTKKDGKYIHDCDLFKMHNNGDYWEEEQPMPYPINDISWNGQASISADGTCLYFSSSRAGGFGGKDIYCSKLDSTGNWGQPINLGNTINTINDEITPFIHYDGKTLYFASNGFFGLGGFDIYRSQLQESGTWSKPSNMGKPINSLNDESGFSTDARGTKGYYATNRIFGKGGWDIFSIDIPESFQPKNYFILNGILTDENEIPIQELTLNLINLNNHKSIPIDYDSFDGTYSLILPIQKDSYLLQINAPSYAYGNQLIMPSKTSNIFFNEIHLSKLKAEIVFPLPQIIISDELTLDLHAIEITKDFAAYMNKHPNLKVALIINPCQKTPDDKQKKSCEDFGNRLIKYLTEFGAEPSQFTLQIQYNQPAENSTVTIQILEK